MKIILWPCIVQVHYLWIWWSVAHSLRYRNKVKDFLSALEKSQYHLNDQVDHCGE
jgi:hypothetical protein